MYAFDVKQTKYLRHYRAKGRNLGAVTRCCITDWLYPLMAVCTVVEVPACTWAHTCLWEWLAACIVLTGIAGVCECEGICAFIVYTCVWQKRLKQLINMHICVCNCVHGLTSSCVYAPTSLCTLASLHTVLCVRLCLRSRPSNEIQIKKYQGEDNIWILFGWQENIGLAVICLLCCHFDGQ